MGDVRNKDELHGRRRRRALYACAALAGLAGLLLAAGLVPTGWTLRFLWIGAFAGTRAIIVVWSQRKLVELGVLVFASVLCIVMANLALSRTIYRGSEHDNLFQFDARLGWRWVPGKTGLVITEDYRNSVTVNPQGFRDFDHSEGTPSGQVVAVLGDSFTSNVGVALEETFTSLLDKGLGPGYSVRNFGINGFGQVQELMLLEEILAEVRPDWVRRYERPVVEFDESGGLEFISDFGPPSVDEGPRKTLYERIRSTALHRLLRSAAVTVEPSVVDPSEVPPEVCYARVPLGAEEQTALTTLSALPPGMIRIYDKQWQSVIDRYGQPDDRLDRDQVHRFLAEDAAKAGRLHLDLVETLQAAASLDTELYYLSEQHWNQAGNAVVAEAIAGWLEGGDSLDEPTAR